VREQAKKLQEKLGAGGTAGTGGQGAGQAKAQDSTTSQPANQLNTAVAQALAEFDKKAAALEGGGGGAGGRGGAGMGGPMGMGGTGAPDTLAGISSSLNQLMSLLQAADAAPTTQAVTAATERREALRALMEKWTLFQTKDLAALNAALKSANLPAIELER